ncbi:probable LEAF RUST 10 DISEASE-RESISTANCE LOCUS RECEPTOR-LIKE PROTEIN [Coccomyxa sp. Obi]|nr:probable LEAF RUST 10 DISEASE-RESISTANCE LOCUS RECEPTOR-LIKE PROTEIN [Coccomyxa sp. Obi]
MAQVYKGRWRGVLVAVKVLDSNESQEELLREASILRRLRHTNIVQFLGLATNDSDQVISFDVKPENILLDHTMTVAKLADVGLAKVLEGTHTDTMGRGTLDYMAPELFGSYEFDTDQPSLSAESKPEITYAVDIYSFGCVLWEIVTGQRMQRSVSHLRAPR